MIVQYTEIERRSDTWLLCKMLTEQMNQCDNPFGRLYLRLRALRDKLRVNDDLSYDEDDKGA